MCYSITMLTLVLDPRCERGDQRELQTHDRSFQYSELSSVAPPVH